MAGTNLKPEDLAERWGVPLRTLDRWRWMGTGPIFMKFGKHVSYKVKDVEAFEDEKRRRDTTCFSYSPDNVEENEENKMIKKA